MHIDLSDKRAVVCGSSQGIGKAVALQLAGAGASVTLLGRNEAGLQAVQRDLATGRGQVHQVAVADFAHPEKVREAANTLAAKAGSVHILVNNTGGPPPGPAHLAEPADFLAAFGQHLLCNQHLVQALLPGMRIAGYGRIINVISTSVKQPIPNLGVSNTIRGAVASWAKTLAGELGRFGITVNNVLPGTTETGRLTSILQNKAARTGKPIEEIVAEEKSVIPLGRFATPEEIAAAVAFLASPLAGYISGINLPIDGGRLSCL